MWKGRVENVLAGMEAAFIEIGLEKNGFLHVDEVVAMGVPKRKRQIAELLKRGDEVLVQATKDPMGTKGVRLTMQLSIASASLGISNGTEMTVTAVRFGWRIGENSDGIRGWSIASRCPSRAAL